MMMHELLAESAQKLADRGIELPVFASPNIPGVNLHDTDIINLGPFSFEFRLPAALLPLHHQLAAGGPVRCN